MAREMASVPTLPGGSGPAALWDSKSFNVSLRFVSLPRAQFRDGERFLITMNRSVLAFSLHSAQTDISGLDLTSEMLAVGICVTLLTKALG